MSKRATVKRAVMPLVGLLGLLALTAALPVSATGWSATGNMTSVYRYGHTATRLNDGRVLVAGGECCNPSFYGSGAIADAEIYNPATGTWSATASMSIVRGDHTATLLTDGRVLVAGGDDGFGTWTATAEIYNPTSGSWSATASMASARTGHTATLLNDGRVLVAGGPGGAELYNPATGTWSATGSMTTSRAFHTATLFADGRVLVAGGGGTTSVSSAEIYDPATNTWSATGSLANARAGHTATLLTNGQVLVAAGYVRTPSPDTITPLASAELYDPTTGTWSATGSLANARSGHTATLLNNGLVLVAGGSNWTWPSGSGGPISSAELYNPTTGSWSATASMTTTRSAHTATLLTNGQVLAAGAGTCPPACFSSELYTQ